MLFFRSSLTVADRKIDGKLSEKSDSLMMAEKFGTRSSRYWFKRDVGSGSSSQVLIMDFCVMFFLQGAVNGSYRHVLDFLYPLFLSLY